MSIDKRISEFDIIEEFDITTKIPIIQGSPLKNGIITPKDFTKSIADDMLIELKLDNVDNTSDIDKPISTAQSTAIGLKADKTYVDNKVKTNVPVGAKFTDTNTITTINGKTGVISKSDIVALGIPAQDTIVDISGKADKTYVDEQIDIINEEIDIINDKHIPMITLTEVEYNILYPKDPDTFYFIKED